MTPNGASLTRWRLLASTLLILGGLIGCTGARLHVRPPIHHCLSPRPAILDDQDQLTAKGREWISQCLGAAYLNCVALAVLREESPEFCWAAFK